MAEKGSDMKAEFEEMRKKMAELEQKNKHQDETLLVMMENVTASNVQLTRVEAEVRRMRTGKTVKKATEIIETTDQMSPLTIISPQFTQISRPEGQYEGTWEDQMTCFSLSTSNNRLFYEPPVISWTKSEVNSSLPPLVGTVHSLWFPWIQYPVRTRAQISKHRLTLQFDPRTTVNDLKLIPTLYYVLKDLKGNAKNKSQSKSYLFGEQPNNELHFEGDLSKDLSQTRTKFLGVPIKNSSYNVNDSVTIEIYIEPMFMLKRVYSYDGRLEWAIEQYGKRKQAAKEGLVAYHESPYFYTGPKGYRVQVLMFLDGYVEGQSGLRAKIRFLRGQFDQDLPKTFVHCTTVTLLDRKDPVGNISKTEERDLREDSEYFIALCSDQSVKALIENDTLYYKVTFE